MQNPSSSLQRSCTTNESLNRLRDPTSRTHNDQSPRTIDESRSRVWSHHRGDHSHQKRNRRRRCNDIVGGSNGAGGQAGVASRCSYQLGGGRTGSAAVGGSGGVGAVDGEGIAAGFGVDNAV